VAGTNCFIAFAERLRAAMWFPRVSWVREVNADAAAPSRLKNLA